MSGAIPVLVVDRYAILRAALQGLLRTESDIRVVGECDDQSDIASLALQFQARVVVVGIHDDGFDPVELTRKLRARDPAIGILLVTAADDLRGALDVIGVGANGYLGESSISRDLVEGIRAVAQGATVLDSRLVQNLAKSIGGGDSAWSPDRLSPRESEILTLGAQGFRSREIANRLGLSIRTVENHRANIAQKLGARNHVEAIRIAWERHLLLDPLLI
jgi:DNA-binding NarL/FixJ family response regulator